MIKKLHKYLQLILFISCVIVIVQCEQPENLLLADGVSIELAKERKSTLDNIVYTLELSVPDSMENDIIGKLSVQCSYPGNKSDIILDFRESPDHIKRVTIDGKNVNYNFINHHIVIPKRYFKTEKIQFNIEFVTGNLSLNRNVDYMYTLFVPDRACTAFPCFDQPDLKAKYNLTLEVPVLWQAVSNSPSNLTEKIGNRKKITFEQTQPLSTYLFSFAAGKFKIISETRNNRKITAYHKSIDSAKIQSNINELFDLHFESIEWLEKYTDVPYPFDKLDFILIPSFQYGGMEHPGATLYRESKLLLNQTATVRDKLSRANLIAHEVAHMWFGNLVTMPWFNEVWLKEVFANFIAGKIIQQKYPEINHDLNFLLSHYPSSYSIDRTKGANPIQQELNNMINAGSVYGSIIYHKSPIVMRFLELKTGEEQLQECIQEYVKTFSYGNAGWNDLIAIIDKKNQEDLTKWSYNWVDEPGMPHIEYSLAYGIENTIECIIFHQMDPEESGRYWSQDIDVSVSTRNKIQNFNTYMADTFAVIPEYYSSYEPEYIFPNSKGMIYGYIELNEQDIKYFLKNGFKWKNELSRAALYITLYENVLNQNLQVDPYCNFLLQALSYETNEQNVSLLSSQFRTIFWRFLNPDEQAQKALIAEEIIWDRMTSNANESEVSSFYSIFKSVAFSEDGIDKLYQLWNREQEIKNLKLSENDFISLAYELSVRNHPNTKQIMNDQYHSIKDTEKQQKFRFISSFCSPDVEVRDSMFYLLKHEKNRAKEPWVSTGLRYLHHPLRAHESSKYIRSSLDMLEEIKATGDIFFPKQWLDATFSGHNNIDAVNEINLFLSENPDIPKDLERKVLQSSDMVFRSFIIAGQE